MKTKRCRCCGVKLEQFSAKVCAEAIKNGCDFVGDLDDASFSPADQFAIEEEFNVSLRFDRDVKLSYESNYCENNNHCCVYIEKLEDLKL